MKEYRVITDFFSREMFWHAAGRSIMYANAYRLNNRELIVKRIRLIRLGSLEQFKSADYQPLPANTLVTVRGELKGSDLFIDKLLSTELQPTADEQQFLDLQLPESFNDDKFGVFYFNKEASVFQGYTLYQGSRLLTLLENPEDAALLAIFDEDFMAAAKSYAAENLLMLAGDWSSEATGVTVETFVSELTPMTISVFTGEEGKMVSIDYEAGCLFGGHNVYVEAGLSGISYCFCETDIFG